MATNTISCNGLHAESLRLQALFDPCYVLTATDLDDMVNLSYSVSLCNSDGELEQNNIIDIVAVPQILTSSETLTTTDIVNAINGMDPFSVGTTEIIIFEIQHKQELSKTTDYETHYYQLIGVGADTYGSIDTQIDSSNLFFIRSRFDVTIASNFNSAPVVYDIETLDLNSLVAPEDVVNADTGTFEVLDTADYYFNVGLYEDNTRTDTPLATGQYYIYRWIGAAGNYGIGGGDTAVLSDFTLIEIIGGTEATVDDTTTSLLVKDNTVGYVMSETENVSDAVNGTFRTDFSIASNELTSFSVQRIVYDTADNQYNGTVTTEKYFWMSGTTVINGDTIETDYLLYDTINVGIVAAVVNAEPVVVSIGAIDIDDPATAVNSETTDTWTIDGSADYYFTTYYNNSNTKLTDPTITVKYNLYRYTGTNKTIGAGGSTVLLSDFTLVLADGEVDPTVSDITKTSEITNDGSDGTSPFVTEAEIPVTTKGDIFTNDGTDNSRLAVGVDGYILYSDSTQNEGLEWRSFIGYSTTGSIVGGDLIVTIGDPEETAIVINSTEGEINSGFNDFVTYDSSFKAYEGDVTVNPEERYSALYHSGVRFREFDSGSSFVKGEYTRNGFAFADSVDPSLRIDVVPSALTTDITVTLPTESGKLALTSEIPSIVAGTGIAVNYVGTAATISATGGGGGSGGTELIDEGNGDGLVIAGRIAANYGNVGLNAVDLGFSNSASSTAGATGANSTLSGGLNNATSATNSTISGGYTNTDSGYTLNTISGGGNNTISVYTTAATTISGGKGNTASASYSTVSGGYDNTASGSYAVVAGGGGNQATGDQATISGGYSNEAHGGYTSVGGGNVNTASGEYSTVSGGYDNTASGGYGANISGGQFNTASGDYFPTIGGGNNNTASGYTASTVSGGNGNTASGYGSTVTGGRANTASGNYSTAGGQSNTAGDGETVFGQYATAGTARAFAIGAGTVGTPSNVLEVYKSGGIVFNPSSQPGETIAGMMYYDSTANKIKFYNGTAWIELQTVI